MSGSLYDRFTGWWNGSKPVSDAKIQEWHEAEKFNLLYRTIQDKHDAEVALIAKGQEINHHQMTLEEHKLIERKKLLGLPFAYATEVLSEVIGGPKKNPGGAGDYPVWKQAEQEHQQAQRQTRNAQTLVADAEGQSKTMQLDIEKLQREICLLNAKVNNPDV